MQGDRNLGREDPLYTCTIEASLGRTANSTFTEVRWTITPMGGEPCTNNINILDLMLDALHYHNQTGLSTQNDLLSNGNGTYMPYSKFTVSECQY